MLTVQSGGLGWGVCVAYAAQFPPRYLTAHRARLTSPFIAAVAEVTEEMAVGDGDLGLTLGEAFVLDKD